VPVAEDLVPTYQYACTACGHRFEAVQSFSDASLTDCPECTGRLRKVFSSVGIVFKGSGFYRTDSRSGAASGGEKSPGGESGGSAAKEGAGSSGAPAAADSKPAATSSTSGTSGSKTPAAAPA
jgi:putative FmdB family regulatory protein